MWKNSGIWSTGISWLLIYKNKLNESEIVNAPAMAGALTISDLEDNYYLCLYNNKVGRL